MRRNKIRIKEKQKDKKKENDIKNSPKINIFWYFLNLQLVDVVLVH